MRRTSRGSLAPPDEQALAATSMTTVQLVGSAFGAAFGGVITNLNNYSDLAAGGSDRAAGWYFSIFCLFPLVAFLFTLLILRRHGGSVSAPEPAPTQAD